MDTHERCQEIFAMLSEYIDLELPADACQEIDAHMQGCAPCIEFAESLKKTVALCRQFALEELPPPIGAEAKRELEAAYQRMLQGPK